MTDKQPPWHFGIKYAGQTLDWLPGDTEENFHKLIAEDPGHLEYFQGQGWLEPGVINYSINSNGFRSDEFDKKTRCIVALGCSYTVGIGLPLKDLWPTLVGNELGLATYNLAWGGMSADTCYRLAEYWIPKLNPELVVMLAPPKSRIELLINDAQAEVFLPSTELNMFGDQDMFLKNWFANDDNARLNNVKNKLAIKQLCHSLGVKCLTYDAHDFMARSRKEVGYSRDYMHAGPKAHQNIYKQVLLDYHG